MSLGQAAHVHASVPLERGIADAFEKLRDTGASKGAIIFDLDWTPTMDVVPIIAEELDKLEDMRTLTLVHPSAAMTFIASAVGLRAENVEIRAQRSIHDDGEEQEDTDATASRTMFMMRPTERMEDFVRTSVTEAKKRLVRRFALIFDANSKLPTSLADVLAEELLHAGVKEIGLVHPNAPLDTIAASLRLRVPDVKISIGNQPAKKV